MSTPVIRPAVDSHVLVRIDDYLTVTQARHFAAQIIAIASQVEDCEAEEARLRDVVKTRALGEQLVGPW